MREKVPNRRTVPFQLKAADLPRQGLQKTFAHNIFPLVESHPSRKTVRL